MPGYFRFIPARSSSGFTLLELLITISVAAIALGIAVPSFTGLMASNQLTTITNELIGSISQARMQAIKRNQPTQFCSNVASQNGTDTLGTGCGTSAGAVVSLDTSGASTTLLSEAPHIPTGISLNTGSNVTALRFAGNGLATTATTTAIYSGLIADVYSTKIKTNNHRCIYLITGSVVSSCKYTANAGGCPTNEPRSCQQQ